MKQTYICIVLIALFQNILGSNGLVKVGSSGFADISFGPSTAQLSSDKTTIQGNLTWAGSSELNLVLGKLIANDYVALCYENNGITLKNSSGYVLYPNLPGKQPNMQQPGSNGSAATLANTNAPFKMFYKLSGQTTYSEVSFIDSVKLVTPNSVINEPLMPRQQGRLVVPTDDQFQQLAVGKGFVEDTLAATMYQAGPIFQTQSELTQLFSIINTAIKNKQKVLINVEFTQQNDTVGALVHATINDVVTHIILPSVKGVKINETDPFTGQVLNTVFDYILYRTAKTPGTKVFANFGATMFTIETSDIIAEPVFEIGQAQQVPITQNTSTTTLSQPQKITKSFGGSSRFGFSVGATDVWVACYVDNTSYLLVNKEAKQLGDIQKVLQNAHAGAQFEQVTDLMSQLANVDASIWSNDAIYIVPVVQNQILYMFVYDTNKNLLGSGELGKVSSNQPSITYHMSYNPNPITIDNGNYFVLFSNNSISYDQTLNLNIQLPVTSQSAQTVSLATTWTQQILPALTANNVASSTISSIATNLGVSYTDSSNNNTNNNKTNTDNNTTASKEPIATLVAIHGSSGAALGAALKEAGYTKSQVEANSQFNALSPNIKRIALQNLSSDSSSQVASKTASNDSTNKTNQAVQNTSNDKQSITTIITIHGNNGESLGQELKKAGYTRDQVTQNSRFEQLSPTIKRLVLSNL